MFLLRENVGGPEKDRLYLVVSSAFNRRSRRGCVLDA